MKYTNSSFYNYKIRIYYVLHININQYFTRTGVISKLSFPLKYVHTGRNEMMRLNLNVSTYLLAPGPRMKYVILPNTPESKSVAWK